MDLTTVAIIIGLLSFPIFVSLGGTFAYQYRFGPRAQLRRRVKFILNPEEAGGGGQPKND